MPVSHQSPWGIPVPVEGFEDQTLLSIVEMVPMLNIWGAALDDGDEPFWGRAGSQCIQFFGQDNSTLAAVVDVALFLAQDPEHPLPLTLLSNEFYQLDGAKFSTVRRHRVLVQELLAEAPVDVVRFHLAATRPEMEETSFSRAALEVDRELLVQAWAGWLADLQHRLHEGFEGEVPATGLWTPEQRRFFAQIGTWVRAAAAAYAPDHFSLQAVADILRQLVRGVRTFAAGEAHWALVPARADERRTAIALELLAAKTLAQIAFPLMPDFAQTLWTALGYDLEALATTWEALPTWVPPGRRITALAGPYFVHPAPVSCTGAIQPVA